MEIVLFAVVVDAILLDKLSKHAYVIIYVHSTSTRGSSSVYPLLSMYCQHRSLVFISPIPLLGD